MSGDFHIRFDNAYYSVDKAYLHKSVMVAATASTVNIYSMKGELIVSWRRAAHRGEWLTDPSHLPESYKQMSEWNAAYFIRRAMTVGPNTVKVIEHILRSREHEVQTYRLCLGILSYTKKYSKLALEDCCRLAIETNHISYSLETGACHREQFVNIPSVSNRGLAVLLLRNDGTVATAFQSFQVEYS